MLDKVVLAVPALKDCSNRIYLSEIPTRPPSSPYALIAQVQI